MIDNELESVVVFQMATNSVVCGKCGRGVKMTNKGIKCIGCNNLVQYCVCD